MIKTRKRWISILLTLTLLATLLVPMATPAAAAGTVTALTAPTVTAAAYNHSFGTLYFELTAGTFGTNNTLVVTLPDNFVMKNRSTGADLAVNSPLNTTDTAPATLDIPTVFTPQTVGGTANANALAMATIDSATVVSSKELKVVLGSNIDPTKKGYLYLYLPGVQVPAGYTGDIEANISANSGFPTGKVKVGSVGTGTVSVTMDKVPSFTESTAVTFFVTENSSFSLKDHASSVKIKLPAGFEWTNTSNITPSTVWGDSTYGGVTVAKRDSGDTTNRTMIIDTSASSNATDYPLSKSSYRFTANIQVSDMTIAKKGKVVATISGESKLAADTVEVANYGDYSVSVTAAAAKEVLAGKTEQDIADITIEEGIVGSLIRDRYIYLELPEGAAWVNKDGTPSATNIAIDGGSLVGSDPQTTVRYQITTASTSNPGKIIFDSQKIKLRGDFRGDVKINVYGSAGAKGEVVVAKATAPATATADVKEVKLGVQDQALGDITIIETKKGALKQGVASTVDLVFSTGNVEWANTPNAEVIEGDITIGNVTKSGGVLSISIKGESNVVSKIKVSGAKITVNRAYPEGSVKVVVRGGSAIDSASTTSWPAQTHVGGYLVANCVTPAPGETKATASFVIGSTKYKVSGIEQTMDVAPYIKGGRTYLPVRYVAQALGVADSNILWDSANQTVTLLKGDKVIQLKIGSKAMIVNGVTITMDTAPEITSGRTMLPFRFIAQAMGASVVWDEATQTVKLN